MVPMEHENGGGRLLQRSLLAQQGGGFVKMRNPKISVFTPTYNHERFIRETAESVIKQEYDNWEMLIIDDESQDNTWSIVEDLCKQDSRIRGFRNAHQGIWNLGKIYNQALTDSDGEIIAILDGDDFWPEDKLRIQVAAHLDLGVGVTFGQWQFADIQGRPIKQGPMNLKLTELTPRELVIANLEGRYPIPAVSVLVNRASLGKIGGFVHPEYLPLVDYPTWITIGFQDGLGYVDRVLGYWRQYSKQTTWQLSRACASGAMKFSRDFIRENAPAIGENWESVLEASQRNRLPYLIDATYREVISATDNDDIAKANRALYELKGLNTRMYMRANAVRAWKSVKARTRRALRT